MNAHSAWEVIGSVASTRHLHVRDGEFGFCMSGEGLLTTVTCVSGEVLD